MEKNLVSRYSYNSDGSDCGVMDKTILVFETKTMFKAQLWNSVFKGWHSKPHQPIKEEKYKKKDGYTSINKLPMVIEATKHYKVLQNHGNYQLL